MFNLKRVPFVIHSSQIFNCAKFKKLKGYLTSLALANVYYVLRKEYSKERIIEEFIKLTSIIEIETTNKKIVQKALLSDFSDFEDALQNYSAENNSLITHIVTRNVKDYKNSKLVVLSPKEFLEIL